MWTEAEKWRRIRLSLTSSILFYHLLKKTLCEQLNNERCVEIGNGTHNALCVWTHKADCRCTAERHSKTIKCDEQVKLATVAKYIETIFCQWNFRTFKHNTKSCCVLYCTFFVILRERFFFIIQVLDWIRENSIESFKIDISNGKSVLILCLTFTYKCFHSLFFLTRFVESMYVFFLYWRVDSKSIYEALYSMQFVVFFSPLLCSFPRCVGRLFGVGVLTVRCMWNLVICVRMQEIKTMNGINGVSNGHSVVTSGTAETKDKPKSSSSSHHHKSSSKDKHRDKDREHKSSKNSHSSSSK